MALYLPGYFLAFWSMEKYGLRTGLCIGAVLQTSGAWIRYFGTMRDGNGHVAEGGFEICFIGQCLAAIAQPMFTK